MTVLREMATGSGRTHLPALTHVARGPQSPFAELGQFPVTPDAQPSPTPYTQEIRMWLTLAVAAYAAEYDQPPVPEAKIC